LEEVTLESQKIYVNRNYRHITCGSVDRVRKVYTEHTDRGPRYYIEGDSRDRSVLKSLRYLEADPLSAIHPPTHTQEKERVEKELSEEKQPETFAVTDKFDEAQMNTTARTMMKCIGVERWNITAA